MEKETWPPWRLKAAYGARAKAGRGGVAAAGAAEAWQNWKAHQLGRPIERVQIRPGAVRSRPPAWAIANEAAVQPSRDGSLHRELPALHLLLGVLPPRSEAQIRFRGRRVRDKAGHEARNGQQALLGQGGLHARIGKIAHFSKSGHAPK